MKNREQLKTLERQKAYIVSALFFVFLCVPSLIKVTSKNTFFVLLASILLFTIFASLKLRKINNHILVQNK